MHPFHSRNWKRCLAALLLSAGLISTARADGLVANDVVAILGDSITEQKNYSVIIEEYLLAAKPVVGAKTIQFGWNGERATGLLGRLGNDVLPFSPNVATTFYGMNDGGYAAINVNTAKAYRDASLGIVRALKKAGVRFIVVGTPGVVDSDTYKRNPDATVYNATLRALGDIGKQIAADEGVGYADVHGVMLDAMAKFKAKHPRKPFAGADGVHPGDNGHLAIAYAFLKALGCDGNIGTITIDLHAGSGTGTDGHQVTTTGDTTTVVSSRWPFVFKGEASDPTSQLAATEFLPFNQDLNRFLLVVKNAPAGKFKVTWGEQTKTFDAAAMEKGINLPAEFPVNPFSPAFAKLDSAVRAQQGFETQLVKDFINKIPSWSKLLPDESETFTRLRVGLFQKQQALAEASLAAVVPVTHTIKIEAEK